jgi:hypothetical protein
MKPTAPESEANRTAKLEAAKAMLVTAVAALQTSEGWMAMLKAMAKVGRFGLRRLSFRNQLLVFAQHPTATAVATFKAWISAGRVVQKGQRAITILAPVIVKDRKAKTADGKEPESKLIGFRAHNVFAEDQTKPLPGSKVEATEPAPKVEDYCRNVEDAGTFSETVETLRAFALASLGDVVTGIDLRPREAFDHHGAHGWFDPSTRRIVVVTGETSRAMQIKTLCHELGHAILHPIGEGHRREIGEVEAESVAFLVCNILGIDSGSYSVGYVSNWAGKEDGEKLILQSGQRIVTAANKILDAFEKESAEVEDPELQAA